MLHREINMNYGYLEHLELSVWEKIKNTPNLKHLVKLGIKVNKICFYYSGYLSYSYNNKTIENYLLSNLNEDIRRCIDGNMNTSEVLKKHKKIFKLIIRMIRNNQRKRKEKEIIEFQREYNKPIEIENKLNFNINVKKLLKFNVFVNKRV